VGELQTDGFDFGEFGHIVSSYGIYYVISSEWSDFSILSSE
jgi:hypothetical protein